jgi:hypothetical protein
VRLVSFPVSREVALIITDGTFRPPPKGIDRVAAMNRQTMARAREFVVSWKESFPGDEFLPSAEKD